MRYHLLTGVWTAVALSATPVLAQSPAAPTLAQSLWRLETVAPASPTAAQSPWRAGVTTSVPAVQVETPWRSQPPTSAPRSGWRPQSTRSAALAWEIGYLGLSAIDTIQTIDCLKRKVCHEANPIFGKQPSPEKLIAAKVVLGAIHFAVFDRVRDRNPRTALRLAQVSCAVQGGVVALNARFTFK